MARLGGEWKKKLESRNCVLMLEDCHLYDQNPLGTIKTFGLHERCITYLNVPRCFFALKSIVEMTLNGTVPLYSKLSGKFLYDVISCALINSLNVGRVDRLVDSQDLRPLPPFAPWDTITKSYKYPGIRTVLDATKKTPPVLIRPWLEKYRQEYLFPIYRGVADSVVYYMPPVAYSIPLIHALNVKKKYAAARHILPDQAIYKTLDRREYWHDEGHMTTAGSRIYTAWLGDQLIAQGILRK